MKTLLIIVIFIFFCCGPFGMLCAKGFEKAEEKGHDGCIVGLMLILMAIFTLCGLFNMCNSCADESPSYDYYDAPRK